VPLLLGHLLRGGHRDPEPAVQRVEADLGDRPQPAVDGATAQPRRPAAAPASYRGVEAERQAQPLADLELQIVPRIRVASAMCDVAAMP
jgi:hypothetical protein